MNSFCRKHCNVYNIVFWALIVFQFCIFFILTNFSPMANDEYAYSCVFWTSQRITNLSDIINSMQNLYMGWSGRIIYNGLFLQSLLFFGKTFIALVSAFTFSLLGLLIFQFNGIRTSFTKKDFILCALFYAVIWFALPDFASILWITGASNYLWPFIFLFLFVLPFIYNMKQIRAKSTVFPYIYPAVAFIAGLSTEIFFTLGGVAALLLLIISKKRKIQIPKHLWIGFILFIAGAVILLAAPGNFARAAAHNSTLWTNLLTAVVILYKNYLFQIVFIFAAIIILFVVNRRSGHKQDQSAAYALLAGALLSVIMVWFTPEFSDRVLIPAAIVILIVVFYMANSALKPVFIQNKFVFCTSIAIAAVMAFSQLQILSTYSNINAQMINRDSVIRSEIAKGIQNISLPPVQITAGRYVHYTDITQDPNTDYNSFLALYWGVNSIVLDPELKQIQAIENPSVRLN